MYFHASAAHQLVESGHQTMFGVLGDGNLYLVEQFTRETGARFYSTSHEAGAVLAAIGWARTTGRVGLACVTHGPGLTNTLTALADAVKSRTPVLVLVGDTDRSESSNLQDIDHRAVVRSVGAHFEVVRRPDSFARDLAAATALALEQQAPVVLNIPVELMWAQVEAERSAPVPERVPLAAPSADDLDHAVGVIASAKRPLVLVGRGAMGTGAAKAALSLAHRLEAPIATTLQAMHLFEGEPGAVGLCGSLATPEASDVITQADCVISLGASLNPWTTYHGTLLEKARVVRVDSSLRALTQHTTADVSVLADAEAFAGAVVRLLDEAETPPSGFAQVAEATLARQGAAPAPSDYGLLSVLARLDEGFPRDRTLVVDGGRFFFETVRRLSVPHPSAYVHALSFGSIGLSLSLAIGAAIGAPGRPVLQVCGDGGFMLGGLAEFSTAVRHGVDLVTVVMNDRAYGAEYIRYQNQGLAPGVSEFAWPDLAPVAESLGGIGVSVQSLADLDGALAALATRDRPVLIDVRLDPDDVPSPL